jgi:hypothetical protein
MRGEALGEKLALELADRRCKAGMRSEVESADAASDVAADILRAGRFV